MAQIRVGLATNLQTLGDSRQVSAYRKQAPTPPSLMVTGFGPLAKTAFGSWQIEFMVQGLAGAPTQESAQIRLDEWISPLGATSVWNAIESDKTLGGIVNNAIVTACDGAQFIETPGGEVLGSTWHVQIEL
jgi:hypothetical protein